MSIQKAAKRDKIRARDGDCCWLCGGVMNFEHPRRMSGATLDHVIPKSKGGPNTRKNLKLAHRRCNQARADSGLLPEPTP